MRLPNILKRERIGTVTQFLDKDKNPHILVITNKRSIVELDYQDYNKRTTVATLKQIKSAKPAQNKDGGNR